jgi:uncharacterized membrane protein
MADATTPPPLPAAGAPSSNRGVMIVLSYLWLLALVPLLVEKDDKDVQWHAKHGVVLMLAELILWIAMYIVQAILGTILGCLFALLTFPVGLAIIAVHILAIVKGLNGGRLIIPGVSQYADRL